MNYGRRGNPATQSSAYARPRAPRLTLWLMLCAIILATEGLSTAAEAAVLKEIQRGTLSMAGVSQAVTIDTVDTTKSVLFFSCTSNDNTTGGALVTGELTDATTVTFTRTTNPVAVSITWEVAEFASGVSVQRGSTDIVASPQDVVLGAAVDLSKSFALASFRNAGVTIDSNDGITALLFDTTTLRFANPGAAGTVVWQVVQYDGSSVQQVTASLAAASASTTAGIVAVDTTKSIVVGNHTISAAVMASDLPRTQFSNASTIGFIRTSTTGTLDFVVYVVEFSDGTAVTHGTASLGNNVLTQSAAVPAVSMTKTAVISTGNYGRQGSTSFATDDNPGHGWATLTLTSATNVDVTRAVGAGSTADVPYQVVEFNRPPRIVQWVESDPLP